MAAAARRLDVPDADLRLWTQVFEPDCCERLLVALGEELCWEQPCVRIAGRRIPVPRLTAWHGDAGLGYSYSGIMHLAEPWTASLRKILARVRELTGQEFNSVLANLYRNGRDSVAWHRDNEAVLGPEPVIASFSLGAERLFRMRHRRGGGQLDLRLSPGTLLLMAGPTQEHWSHCLPKTRAPVGARINLSFRCIAAADPVRATEAGPCA